MPQHPPASWQAEIGKHSAEVEKIRKKINIQLRKLESAFEDIVKWFVDGKADRLDDDDVWPALASQV